MSLARRQAVITLVVWSVVLIGLATVLASTGIDRFSRPDDHGPRTVVAGLLLPGLLVSAWFATRQARARRAGGWDERDESVARRASEITLVALAIVFYLLGVVLWIAYRDTSGAPAGWFYVLAYVAVALTSWIHAGARLICDLSGDVGGQGAHP